MKLGRNYLHVILTIKNACSQCEIKMAAKIQDGRHEICFFLNIIHHDFWKVIVLKEQKRSLEYLAPVEKKQVNRKINESYGP